MFNITQKWVGDSGRVTLAHVASTAQESAKNHPLAIRMAIVAAVSHNVVVGTVFGTFSVMLASVQERMQVSPEAAAAGVPLVVLAASIISPAAGVLVGKYSLRLLLLLGALMTAGAFFLLAFTTSFAVYLIAYGLLLGPAMSLGGSIGPATLVTRWFSRNRGLALGLVHLPIIVAILPVVSNWVFERYGAQATYLMLGILAAAVLAPLTLLVVNHPPEAADAVPQAASHQTGNTADGSLSVPQLLCTPRFWGFAISGSALTTGSVMLGTILVPMAMSWGIERGNAALLASIMSLVGMVGSVLFGAVADRIGGTRALVLLTALLAAVWAILLVHPPFPVLAVVIGLIGMCGAGMIPSLSRGISDVFGAASFSRGFGLITTIGLPFVIAAVLGSQRVYGTTGSYAPAIVAMVMFYLIGVVSALLALRGSKPEAVPPSLPEASHA